MLDEKIAQLICSYTPKCADQLTWNKRTTCKLLTCWVTNGGPHCLLFMLFCSHKIKQIKASASSSSAIFCRHCLYVTSDVCHGSMISSADCLWKLNHAHKSWPTLSIVW